MDIQLLTDQLAQLNDLQALIYYGLLSVAAAMGFSKGGQR